VAYVITRVMAKKRREKEESLGATDEAEAEATEQPGEPGPEQEATD
jgi:hypothetical protein